MKDGGGGRQGPKLKRVSALIVAVALAAGVALFICDAQVNAGYARMERANERYIASSLAASEMSAGSNYLTDRVRCFTVTGDLKYLRDYFQEAEVTRRRNRALDDLENLLEGSGGDAYASLARALEYSDELMEREYLAMRLTQLAFGYADSEMPPAVASLVLSEEDQALTDQDKRQKARELMFDEIYLDYKAKIQENVSRCADELHRSTSTELEDAGASLNRLLIGQTWLTVAMLLAVLCLVVFIFVQVLVPIARMVRMMRKKKMIEPSGAEELRFVARTYNEIFEENQKAHQDLTYDVMHDALTGLFNRRAYDMFVRDVDLSHAALLLIDVDDFKHVNDVYGHDGGDRVLKRVAQLLRQSFRSVDLVCRIGGDEFAVIMTRVSSEMSGLVRRKVTQINEALHAPADVQTPPASLSVGVAFADRPQPQGDLFKDADTALYQVKKMGRRGCVIYGEKTP